MTAEPCHRAGLFCFMQMNAQADALSREVAAHTRAVTVRLRDEKLGLLT